MQQLFKVTTDDNRTDAINFNRDVIIGLTNGVAATITLPPEAAFVRFAYPTSTATLWASPDPIVLPPLGAQTTSRAEPNPIIRSVADLVGEGITDLNLLADGDNLIVKISFYRNESYK